MQEQDLYKNKPLWWQVLYAIGLFFLYLVPQVVMGPFVILGLGKKPVVVFLLVAVILGILVLIYKMALRRGLIGPVDLKFFSGRNLAMVGIGCISIYVINFIVSTLFKMESTANQSAVEDIFVMNQPLVMFLLVVVLAAVCEEIIFRGALRQLFDGPNRLNHCLAFVAPTLLFAFSHGPTDLGSFLIYFLMGAILATVAWKSQRVEVSIMLHFLNNALSYLAMLSLYQ